MMSNSPSSSSQQVRLDNPYGRLHLGSNQGSAGFVTFDIGSDYQVLEAIGTGTYGVVGSAIWSKTGMSTPLLLLKNKMFFVVTRNHIVFARKRIRNVLTTVLQNNILVSYLICSNSAY